MSSPLFDFLSHVDDAKGVTRQKEFVEQALAICSKNSLEHTFELAEFNWDKCAEGALSAIALALVLSCFGVLSGAAPVGTFYGFLKRASRMAELTTAQQLAQHQTSPTAGTGEGVSGLVQAIRREMVKVNVDMKKQIQVCPFSCSLSPLRSLRMQDDKVLNMVGTPASHYPLQDSCNKLASELATLKTKGIDKPIPVLEMREFIPSWCKEARSRLCLACPCLCVLHSSG